jgi:hypothetical protein
MTERREPGRPRIRSEGDRPEARCSASSTDDESSRVKHHRNDEFRLLRHYPAASRSIIGMSGEAGFTETSRVRGSTTRSNASNGI